MRKSLEIRFWEKVKKQPNGCWIWESAFTTRHYGFFWVGGKKRSEYAHRVAWQLANNQNIPSGMIVMHTCDNTRCVNPKHLRVGTYADNSQDAVAKNRNAYGEKNGGGKKLNEQQVREILATDGIIGPVRAGKLYGVDRHIIYGIRKRKLWRRVSL